ncbi:hypothetical protein [Streptomyces sp. NPDC093984]|uniref:hypothetical protein n=1 Tax=Streptomyces sp. NPDC093984 TaxID=3366052 RepID=UPI00381C2910
MDGNPKKRSRKGLHVAGVGPPRRAAVSAAATSHIIVHVSRTHVVDGRMDRRAKRQGIRFPIVWVPAPQALWVRLWPA